MAYYPRKYIPDFPPLSRQSDYPPPRPDYPLPYEPYYPRRRQAYPPYEPEYPVDRSQGYPPLPSTMAESRRPLQGSDIRPREDVYNPIEYVVNKRYKYYGIVLCFLSVASFAIEIANVIFTIFNFKAQYTNVGPLAVPFILTWIAAGIWGSIPVFITGILAIKVAGTYKSQVRVFALFCSLSAVVFAPAMIALSIAEIIIYPSTCNTSINGSNCYSFDVMSTLTRPKFVLPLVVAILGGIEFYLTLMVTVVFWCCKPGKEVKRTTKAVPSSFDYDRDGAPYSPYDPEMVRRRQAPYYRGLPPNGLQPQEDSMAADPEMQVVRLPQRVDIAPDLSFLRSYHDSRPFMSRGFGIAPAYNHGLSYGNLPGAAPSTAYPFSGSMPSLAAFGTPGPNPAYRIVYN